MTEESVKEMIRARVEEDSDYGGDVIDDYMVYHPDSFDAFGRFFGSIVYVMTPIGKEYYYKVKDGPDGYRERRIQ